ncbi:unnamed protein product [Ceutorhynchus assimilis]|uniref:Uncharacterized protein n=1 Tax=Ceutorhynchus assimilis TaxID=467358 RepID=A0A9N9MI40_9CUCU|nr:unnamed protein product [Ceutorhynchus assimilis]
MEVCHIFLKHGYNGKSEVEIIDDISACLEESGINFNLTHRQDILKHTIKNLIKKWAQKWRDSSYSWAKFTQNNASWLAEKLFTDTHELFDVPEPVAPGPSKKKCFSDLSASQQERNTKDIRDNYCSEALTYAAISVLRKEQKPDLAKAVTIAVKSPEKVLSVPSQKLPKPFSPNEAIALFIINGKQTKAQYQNMRAATIWKDNFTEIEAKVSLQNLVDITVEQILVHISDLNHPCDIVSIYKWGMDGSSGHPEFKQRFIDSNSTDSTVFCTNLVPLLLKTGDSVIWKNESPSSSSLCRPIRIAFCKEDTASTQKEYSRVMKEIDELANTTIRLNNSVEVTVQHEFLFTMVDGKIINAISENKATSRCPVCLAGPKSLNEIPKENTTKDVFKFGISPLHAKINCMEFLLRCSYKTISPEAYKKYAFETAELFLNIYPQFKFSPTVHKILYHGHEYLEKFPSIPLGALSEERQEARNKDFKKFRTDFSRKISRKANLQDVFNRLMLTSDPLFFHIYQTFQKSKLSKKTEKEHLPIDLLNIEACIVNDIMAQAYDSSSDEESEEIDSNADDANDSENEFEDILL